MRIDSLKLHEFSAFQDVQLDFSPGINVFLGTNATGKSHAMKALYAPLKVFERPDPAVPLASRLQQKLSGVYKPDDGSMGRLVRRRRGQGPGTIDIDGPAGKIGFTVNTRPQKPPIEVRDDTWKSEAPSIYLPTREVLAMYEGFVAAYQNRELSFDETYYDACFALGSSVLKGRRSEEAKVLIKPIEDALGGRVVLQGSRFYLTRPDGNMEAHLVSEGLRKIACLAHLVLNGSLTTNGVLLWDEPEANLNPRLCSLVVDILLALSKRGVQIFVTTHDYLLARKLSLLSEYGKTKETPVRFFAFYRKDGEGPVHVGPGATLEELPDNPILDEHLKHYDFERDLFTAAE